MDHQTWKREYDKRYAIAERIEKSRLGRLRAMTEAAGLDPSLMGVHVHNCYVSYEHGIYWRNVDIQLVKKIYWRMREGWQFEGYRIVRRWSKRVRSC